MPVHLHLRDPRGAAAPRAPRQNTISGGPPIRERLPLHLSWNSTGYRCIPVQRRRRKALSICVTKLSDYGDFGGMELSGTIVISRHEMFERLQETEPQDLTTRIQMAYWDTCEEHPVSV